MTFNIEYETDLELHVPYKEIITKVIEEALDYEKCPFEVELNVVLTDNKEIHNINKEYRQIDRPTDVLSFPLVDYEKPSDYSVAENNPQDYFNPETGELMLGDIIISVEKVIEQAESYGHSEERELAFLTAHSMLHLFGYDHMEQEEAKRMEKKQEEVLNHLNILR